MEAVAHGTTNNDAQPATQADPEGRARRWPTWVTWVAIAVMAVALLLLLRVVITQHAVEVFQRWIDGLGWIGPVVFGGVYVAATVALVPGSLLTLAAGAIFGLLWGTVIVSIASVIGAAAAFLIARYLARERVRRVAERHEKFGAIDRAIDEGGWKIVAMLRLSPAIPFNLQNYLYGLTPIRFWPYFFSSWIAMLPGTFLYVYLGFAAKEAATAGGQASVWRWVLLGVGLAATVAVTVYITHLARKQLARQTEVKDEQGPERPAATGGSPGRAIGFAAAAVLLAAAAGGGYAFQSSVQAKINGWIGAIEKHQPKPGGPTVDHSLYARVLDAHVTDGGWVDYAALAEDTSSLDRYIQQLAGLDMTRYGRDEKLAAMLNAYNAWTLKLITEYWGEIESIRDIPAAKRWEDDRWELGGETYSLNEMEHQTIRTDFVEPRIHWALVCAAVGCPPLRDTPFTGAELNKQLERQTEVVHTHGTWVRYEPGAETIRVSALYDWYGADFAKPEQYDSKLDFMAGYVPGLREAIQQGNRPEIEYLDYDWTLNSLANKRPR